MKNPATCSNLSIDAESTGIDPFTARIVTLSAVWVPEPGSSQEPRIKNWLVTPDIEIPQQSIEVHGITNEKAKAEGRPITEALPEFIETVSSWVERGGWVTAFNTIYDSTLIAAEAERHGITLPENLFSTMLDAAVLDKVVDKYRSGSRTLAKTAEFYGVVLDNAHNSDADSIASGMIIQRLFASDKGARSLSGLSAEELFDLQREAKREQSEDLTKYKHGKANEPDFWAPRSWPIRTRASDEADIRFYGMDPQKVERFKAVADNKLILNAVAREVETHATALIEALDGNTHEGLAKIRNLLMELKSV